MNSFLNEEELKRIGFLSCGRNVLISRRASIYGANNINIGNNVRIDDFCIVSGTIEIGNYVHIAAYTGLFAGNAGIFIDDYANISSRNSIYAISDDYTGITMTNPMISDEFKNVLSKKVIIERHVIIGSGCVVLPGVVLREGSAFGALSFINSSSEEWTINAGIPCKSIKKRSNKLLEYEEVISSRNGLKGE